MPYPLVTNSPENLWSHAASRPYHQVFDFPPSRNSSSHKKQMPHGSNLVSAHQWPLTSKAEFAMENAPFYGIDELPTKKAPLDKWKPLPADPSAVEEREDKVWHDFEGMSADKFVRTVRGLGFSQQKVSGEKLRLLRAHKPLPNLPQLHGLRKLHLVDLLKVPQVDPPFKKYTVDTTEPPSPVPSFKKPGPVAIRRPLAPLISNCNTARPMTWSGTAEEINELDFLRSDNKENFGVPRESRVKDSLQIPFHRKLTPSRVMSICSSDLSTDGLSRASSRPKFGRDYSSSTLMTSEVLSRDIERRLSIMLGDCRLRSAMTTNPTAGDELDDAGADLQNRVSVQGEIYPSLASRSITHEVGTPRRELVTLSTLDLIDEMISGDKVTRSPSGNLVKTFSDEYRIRSPSGNLLTPNEVSVRPDRPLTIKERQESIRKAVSEAELRQPKGTNIAKDVQKSNTGSKIFKDWSHRLGKRSTSAKTVSTTTPGADDIEMLPYPSAFENAPKFEPQEMTYIPLDTEEGSGAEKGDGWLVCGCLKVSDETGDRMIAWWNWCFNF